ncbi:MAG: phosphatase PAP2 family protein [Chloroflexota bacterium]|nr:phosphatase PAP2 family protein [Chloroflexota bacterium]
MSDDAAAVDAAAGTPVPEAAGPNRGLGRRNDRLLLALVAGYIALLSALMIARGVSITPDVLLVALGLAAVLVGRGRLFVRDWIPFIGLFFAYELMRGYADNLGFGVHVADVLAVERALFGGQVPTAVLQAWLHPATGIDLIAVVATVFYFLHFPLPIAVGFFLWLRRRRDYYDYVAALIVLSMAGFITYLLLPVAPPWYAAREGLLPGVIYLKDQGFTDLARFFGFEGHYLFSYTIYQINPNQVAAFPSLHAGYPFLAFLFARRAFGRVGWLMLVYAACVMFAIVYLADHYVVDIVGGIAYAGVAYWAVIHGPGRLRRLIDRAADEELEAGAEAAAAGDRGALGRLGRHVRWSLVRNGLIVAGAGGAAGVLMANFGLLGGSGTALFLVPWFGVLGGLSWAAAGLLSR